MIVWPDGFDPREWQKLVLPLIADFFEQNKSVALEVSTGGGKTPLGLGVVSNMGGKFLYLAHTRDQLDRVWEDNKKWFKLPLIYLIGKRALCARSDLWTVEEGDEDPDTETKENPCDICALKSLHDEIDCNHIERPSTFVSNIVKKAMTGFMEDVRKGKILIKDKPGEPYSEKISAEDPSSMKGFCPYYSVKRSLPKAKMVLGTYNYALNPWIRQAVFEVPPPKNLKRGGSSGEVYDSGYELDEETLPDEVKPLTFSVFKGVIFDEAHNLDSTIKDLGKRLSIDTLVNAFKELFGLTAILSQEDAIRYKDASGGEGLSEFLFHLYQFIIEPENKSDGHLRKMLLPDYLRAEFDRVQFVLQKLSLKEKEEGDGLLYSNAAKVYNFFVEYVGWSKNSDYGIYLEGYLRKKNATRRLRIMPFDLSKYFTFLQGIPVLFFSGTLPSENHIGEIWGRPDVVYLNPLESGIIIPHAKKEFHILKDVTTQGFYNATDSDQRKIVKEYFNKIIEVFENANQSVLVAFTNKKIMQMFYELVQNVPQRGLANSCIMPKDKLKADWVRKQMSEGRKLVLGVFRGSLLEGVEFLDNDKRSMVSDIVLAGVPYPPPDDYSADFAEFILRANTYSRLTKWVIMSDEPALTAARQAIGRATRSPSDSVNVWFLDYRFGSPFWKHNLIREDQGE